jgi:pimeloyl-ACP methyl ester carboxylesterase
MSQRIMPVVAESGRVPYGPYELAYEIYGKEDGVPCVLVHGILLDALVNRDLAVRVAALGYRVMLLDLLGHGHSSRPTDPKEHRTDFYAEQVLAAMDHLQFDQAVVGGVSLGAITALQVAARAPQRVRALFIEMPVMEWSTPFAAAILAPLLFAARYARWPYALMARGMRRLPRPRSNWLASVMNAMSADPKVVTAILHGTLVGPIVPPIRARRAMTMPALVIGHAGDRLHEFEDARALAQQLPNARLLEARHLLELRTNPDRLWPQIQSFLREVPGQAGRRKRPAPRRVRKQGVAP